MTALALDLEEADTDNMHDLVTNNSYITIKTPGLYWVYGTAGFAVVTAGRRMIRIRSNGTTTIAASEPGSIADATSFPILTCGRLTRLAATNYIELGLTQTSGGAVNTYIGASHAPYLEALWVGL